MNPKKNKYMSKRTETRSLKIHSKYQTNSPVANVVPQIILRGKWLEELGFQKESRVTVQTTKELIIIRPEEQE